MRGISEEIRAGGRGRSPLLSQLNGNPKTVTEFDLQEQISAECSVRMNVN